MSFQRISMWVSRIVGTSYAFFFAFFLIVAWAVSGPFLHFSEVWQLTINTATTIITFLMVFLIQSSQNNDTSAIHLKLDEILHAIDDADNSLIGVENRTKEEVKQLKGEVEKVVADDGSGRPQ